MVQTTYKHQLFPAPFVEAAGKTYLQDLASTAIGQLKTWCRLN